MVILLIGIIVLGVGIAMCRNPEVDRLLKSEDYATWKRVMNPSENGYVTTFGAIQLFSWVLAHGYDNSSSQEIKLHGAKILGRAKTARYLMLIGVLLLVSGFFMALLYPK